MSGLDKDLVRPLVLALLVPMATYTAWRKDFGSQHAPRLHGRCELLTGAALGAALGFYDGFFGPGTGSLLLFGYDFLAASASAKVVNVATNLAGLSYFVWTGQVLYHLALPMAACNMLGFSLSMWLALRHGTGFVRVLFLVVVSGFILKLGWDIGHAG